eukprot:3219242-Lingulodinium_polyedra.AAC.1
MATHPWPFVQRRPSGATPLRPSMQWPLAHGRWSDGKQLLPFVQRPFVRGQSDTAMYFMAIHSTGMHPQPRAQSPRIH